MNVNTSRRRRVVVYMTEDQYQELEKAIEHMQDDVPTYYHFSKSSFLLEVGMDWVRDYMQKAETQGILTAYWRGRFLGALNGQPMWRWKARRP